MRKIKSSGAKDLADAACPETKNAPAAPASDLQRSEMYTERGYECTMLDPWRDPGIVGGKIESSNPRFHPELKPGKREQRKATLPMAWKWAMRTSPTEHRRKMLKHSRYEAVDTTTYRAEIKHIRAKS